MSPAHKNAHNAARLHEICKVCSPSPLQIASCKTPRLMCKWDLYIYNYIYIICSYFLQLAKAFKMDRRTTWYSMVPGAISRGSTVFCQSYMSSPNKCCLHRGFTWVYKKQYKSSIHSLQVTSLSSSSSKHQELHSKQAKPVHILDLQELHNKNKLGRGGLRTTPTPLSTSPRAACALANLSVYSF